MNSLGYYGYLEWQLNHEAMGDPECEARLQALTTINLAPLTLYNSDSAVVIRELTEATIIRAIYSNRQLFERMVEFWADHFNTNITSVGIFKTLEVREVYRRHALGTFAGMLNASASSPAMLTYLNNTTERRDATGMAGAEPELRSRVVGAPHARRRWRLHPTGCRGDCALLQRVAHVTAIPETSAPERFSTIRTGTTIAASSCWACRLPPAAASTTA